MGDVREGGEKDVSNGTDVGGGLKGNCTFSVFIRDQ